MIFCRCSVRPICRDGGLGGDWSSTLLGFGHPRRSIQPSAEWCCALQGSPRRGWQPPAARRVPGRARQPPKTGRIKTSGQACRPKGAVSDELLADLPIAGVGDIVFRSHLWRSCRKPMWTALRPRSKRHAINLVRAELRRERRGGRAAGTGLETACFLLCRTALQDFSRPRILEVIVSHLSSVRSLVR